MIGERAAGEIALSELERDMLCRELEEERTENVGRLRVRLVTVASTGEGGDVGGRAEVGRTGELASGEEGRLFGTEFTSRAEGVVDKPSPVVDDLLRFQNERELVS